MEDIKGFHERNNNLAKYHQLNNTVENSPNTLDKTANSLLFDQ